MPTKTQSTEARRAAGRRAVYVWLPAKLYRKLQKLSRGSTKTETIVRALEALDGHR